ncbi:hypothetical protein QCE63_33860 [Caballeronia sp. LZ065]|uniref:hypothetical protein n=1 Tax=Caballeronia sp. LZ065 TaxID=3038571 RepID=UPI00285A7FEC|nr:hypothetical protein [Caballeronia sp. LZ065]MDR5784408.1 hypothetical protein [Caballeronia sp. LZ065]
MAHHHVMHEAFYVLDLRLLRRKLGGVDVFLLAWQQFAAVDKAFVQAARQSSSTKIFAANGVTLMQGYFFEKPAFRSIPASTQDWLTV